MARPTRWLAHASLLALTGLAGCGWMKVDPQATPGADDTVQAVPAGAVDAQTLPGAPAPTGPTPLTTTPETTTPETTMVAPAPLDAADPAPVTPVTPPAATARTVTVQPGDTLLGLARRNSVPMAALAQANGLTPPYGLQAGQTLTLPAGQWHTVAAGETLIGLARRYGSTPDALAAANGLTPPYNIQVGQRLRVDGAAATAPAVAAAPPAAPVAATPPTPASAPTPPAATPVPTPTPSATGAPTSLTGAPASPSAPAAAGATAGTWGGAGGVPPLTPASSPTMAAPAAAEAVASATQNPKANAEAAAEAAHDAASDAAATASESAPAPEAAALPEPPARTDQRFLWPVKGRIIVPFGGQTGGLQNDGVNIAAAKGTNVRAAENGVVAYVGNELRGFGNLVLIRHADGYVTAYAHLDQVAVRRGETVRRGQSVGQVGASGRVDGPQLHFEIRKDNQPVDPQPLLAGRSVSARDMPAGRPHPG